MINFEFLEENCEQLRLNFLLAKPFAHLAIDNFCEEEKLLTLYENMPEIKSKSRDYVFAANKFEKSNIKDISPLFGELYQDLTSSRFERQGYLTFIWRIIPRSDLIEV
jgi:hypothetical protein